MSRPRWVDDLIDDVTRHIPENFHHYRYTNTHVEPQVVIVTSPEGQMYRTQIDPGESTPPGYDAEGILHSDGSVTKFYGPAGSIPGVSNKDPSWINDKQNWKDAIEGPLHSPDGVPLDNSTSQPAGEPGGIGATASGSGGGGSGGKIQGRPLEED